MEIKNNGVGLNRSAPLFFYKRVTKGVTKLELKSHFVTPLKI